MGKVDQIDCMKKLDKYYVKHNYDHVILKANHFSYKRLQKY